MLQKIASSCKKVFDFCKQKTAVASVAVGTGLTLVSQASHAALPASVATTITGIETDGQAMFDLVFPVVGLFLGLGILIKLFKRFSNKV